MTGRAHAQIWQMLQRILDAEPFAAPNGVVRVKLTRVLGTGSPSFERQLELLKTFQKWGAIEIVELNVQTWMGGRDEARLKIVPHRFSRLVAQYGPRSPVEVAFDEVTGNLRYRVGVAPIRFQPGRNPHKVFKALWDRRPEPLKHTDCGLGDWRALDYEVWRMKRRLERHGCDLPIERAGIKEYRLNLPQ